MRRALVTAIGLLGAVLAWPSPAAADILRGLAELVGGVVEVPLATLVGTFNGPPVIGTAIGAISGVATGVGMVAHGAFELVASAVPLAKAAAPFVLPFLF